MRSPVPFRDRGPLPLPVLGSVPTNANKSFIPFLKDIIKPGRRVEWEHSHPGARRRASKRKTPAKEGDPPGEPVRFAAQRRLPAEELSPGASVHKADTRDVNSDGYLLEDRRVSSYGTQQHLAGSGGNSK